MTNKPNVVFVFADQWRQQATGFGGNPQVQTPHLDRLARDSLDFTHAVSGTPVCCPYRACLLTGQGPLTHGVFLNDVCLRPQGPSIAEAFRDGGYDTAYIGKWHLDGHGRSSFIPRKRRLGFDYWKVLECTHDYNHSAYFAGDSEEKQYWKGYDAEAQTRDAQNYLRDHDGKKPFLLMLSWGPPHSPYHTAPEAWQKQYSSADIELRPNVPEALHARAREQIAGYYAHCSALDACVGDLLGTLEECGLAENTIFVFTSDHGDMLGSQGENNKQQPWEESIRVPFLLRSPGIAGWQPGKTPALINAWDIMPTLLGLCGQPIPDSVEGLDFSAHICGGDDPTNGSTLLLCAHPFGQWSATRHGGREYRGLRTTRYTYVRDLHGPWLLFDNETDPCQMQNLVNHPQHAKRQADLDAALNRELEARDDHFLAGREYLNSWGYAVDENGTITYED